MFAGMSGSRLLWARLHDISRALSMVALKGSALKAGTVGPISSLVYRLYTSRLMDEVREHGLPTHVAMILDGNRRFARSAGLSKVTEGYRYGASKVREVIGWCDELSIPVVTLWGISTDNLKRSPTELSQIFETVGAQLDSLSREAEDSVSSRRIRAVGRVELLPGELRRQIEAAERRTASFGPHILNVAVAYGGRDEILDAVKRMLRDRSAAGESATCFSPNRRHMVIRSFVTGTIQSTDE